MAWTACVDGSAKGAGRSSRGHLGVGVVLINDHGEVVEEIAAAPSARGCCNEAEARAVLLAITRAVALGCRELVIVTDSAVVADELSGRRPVRAPRLRALFDDVRDARAGISEVSVRRVPRAHNAAADALARLGRERVTRP